MAKRKKATQKPERVQATSAAAQGVQIPSWVPVILYGVVTLFLFRGFVFSREMLFGSDTLALGYMAREFYATAMSGEGFPLWNPIILGGTPFIESLAGGDSLYPPSALLLFLLDPYRALGWKLVLHVFFAGIFMYGWIRRLGCDRTERAARNGAMGIAAPGFDSAIISDRESVCRCRLPGPILIVNAVKIQGARGPRGAVVEIGRRRLQHWTQPCVATDGGQLDGIPCLCRIAHPRIR